MFLRIESISVVVKFVSMSLLNVMLILTPYLFISMVLVGTLDGLSVGLDVGSMVGNVDGSVVG